MPQAMIYVFKEPRYHKTKAASAFPYMYDNLPQLEKQLFVHLESDPAVYHVTAFNSYGQMISELYRSHHVKYSK